METITCRQCGQVIPIADPAAAPIVYPYCHAAVQSVAVGDAGSAATINPSEAEINPFASPGELQHEEATFGRRRPPSNELVWIALVLPVLAAIAECLVGSEGGAMAISFAAVAGTSVLLFIDASKLGPRDLQGVERTGPGVLLIGGILLWIVFYPVAFFRRRHYGGPNLGPASLLVAAIFMGLPLGLPFLIPQSLPACDSPEVKQTLVKIFHDLPLFKNGKAHLREIDAHRQVDFDAEKQIRKGTCTVHTDNADIPVTFTVSWQDRNKAMFYVRIINND